MEDPAKIQLEDLKFVIKYFLSSKYRARGSRMAMGKILDKCNKLYDLDNNCMVVPNDGGELCSGYPNRLIIPESEISPGGRNLSGLVCPLPLCTPTPSFSVEFGGAQFSTFVNQHSTVTPSLGNESRPGDGDKTMKKTAEVQSNAQKLRDLILEAKLARRGTGFPVPVILYNGKYICRSATLSGGREMYRRSGLDYLLPSAGSSTADDDDEVTKTNSNWQLFDSARSQDIRLLKTYNVGVIVDLVLEKKVKESSSEKVDKDNRYRDFKILSLPYPGCEFFKGVRNRGYSAEDLYINWEQPYVDAHLVIPKKLSAKVTSDWNNYHKWDLLTLSQNCLKLLLTCAHNGSKGILIHCVSGWDCTPLFISLLRLSLWADGLIHKSLDYVQILYLTIVYDWMAFGFDLHDRLYKDIFFFCFHFLKYITSDEFVVGEEADAGSDDLWDNEYQEPPRASTSTRDNPVSLRQQAPRTRNDSVSSIESWQLVSEMESPPGSTRGKSDMLDSAHTVKEESCDFEDGVLLYNRRGNLHKVRDAFYNSLPPN